MFKVWLMIRKPIGLLLFTGLLYSVLIILHLVPAFLAAWILGF